MKVLHVITSLDTGGAEKLMVDLLPRLKERDVEVDLAIFDGTRTPFYDLLEKSGVKIIPFSADSYTSPLHIFRLAKLLPQYNIVHAHNGWCQLYVAIASLFSKATLCTTEHSNTNHRRHWGWYRQIDRWMYRRYGRIICITEAVKKNLRMEVGVAEDKMTVVNNGIDVEKYTNAKPIASIAENKQNKKIILMVAGFRKQKDQDTLIKAVALLPDDYVLWLAGDGERRSEIEKLIKDLNIGEKVNLLGVCTNLPSLLKTADIVVLSSHSEGFGLAAVEGMAAGKPVIASNVPGLSEIVEGAGLMFPATNAEELSKLIMQISSNEQLYQKVSIQCKERASRYDISIMVDRYKEIYDGLV